MNSFCGYEIKERLFQRPEETTIDAGTKQDWDGKHRIYRNEVTKNLPIRIQKAIYWHEVGHIRQDRSGEFCNRMYFSNADYRLAKEKEADLLAIKKGYGKELIFVLKHLLAHNTGKDRSLAQVHLESRINSAYYQWRKWRKEKELP